MLDNLIKNRILGNTNQSLCPFCLGTMKQCMDPNFRSVPTPESLQLMCMSLLHYMLHVSDHIFKGKIWIFSEIGQGLLYRWTEHSANCYFFKWPLGEEKRPAKLHPRGGFFGPWSFIILKNSHQDLSNEGSSFILSPIEVGHWVAQMQPFWQNT